jgi:hypothetical protein
MTQPVELFIWPALISQGGLHLAHQPGDDRSFPAQMRLCKEVW